MTITSSSVIKKLLVLFLVFAGLHFAGNFLIPLTIGIVLATLFLPFYKWMEERKVPKILAAFICLLIILLTIAGVAALIGWQVIELTNDFDLIKQKSIQLFDSIQEFILNNIGISVAKQNRLLIDQQQFVSGFIQMLASSLSSIFFKFILILVYVLFLLYFHSHIKQFLLKLSPPSHRSEMAKLVSRVTKVSQQYLQGLFKMIVFLWIMYGIGFSILGIKNAIFFAILCGLLEIIPFIGNITGVSITILVATVHGASFPLILGIMGTYALVQMIQGWVLEPLVVGSKVRINPLFTIIALVIGEMIWGIPGIFLAIPLMAMFKIVCDHIDSLKPYGFLIGKIEIGKIESELINKIKVRIKKKTVNND